MTLGSTPNQREEKEMRKRTIWFLASMMVLLGCGITLLADKAIVINDFGCGLFDGNGIATSVDSSHVVITPSGNASMTCQGTVTPPQGGTAVQFDESNKPVPCGIFTGGTPLATDNWQETVSADGQATLTCHYNAQ